MALALAAQWIANYLVSWTFPMLDGNPTLVIISITVSLIGTRA